MATNFPTSLDTFTNPNSGNTLDSPSHSVQHSDINDAVEAIEAKVGVGSSTAGSATAGYALVNTSGGTTAYSLLGVSGLSSGTAPIDTFLRADGAGGAAFASVSTAQGLTLLVPSSVTVGGTAATGSVSATGTITFGTATSVSVNDVFSATYDNYVIVLNGVLGDAGFLTMRLRVAGSDESASQYFTQSIFAGGSSVSAARTSSATSWNEAFRIETAVQNLGMFYLYNPFKTIVTTAQSSLTTAASGSGIDFTSYGRGLNTTTSYTGFTITPATNSITGSISTYGFNK